MKIEAAQIPPPVCLAACATALSNAWAGEGRGGGAIGRGGANDSLPPADHTIFTRGRRPITSIIFTTSV